ncbi:hypothetical protein, partial [Tenacibaculum maritimum]|uniref:hypothetical protein n=1 Tax=Tenacibaculum maritimum TaxID=107401 RepID=UPI0038772F81
LQEVINRIDTISSNLISFIMLVLIFDKNSLCVFTIIFSFLVFANDFYNKKICSNILYVMLTNFSKG